MLLRFLRRPWIEQRLLLRALAWTLLYAIWIRIASGRRVAMALRESSPGRASASRIRPAIAQITWAVTGVAAHVPAANCFVQSLVGRRMLLKAGYPAELRLGVRNHRDFEAHAWIESNGKTLLPIPHPESDYAELPLRRTVRERV
ncbi:MAG TPA: lasso peptide biosynthesis B2 protein [Terriglobales bacterium]|nr:lasso peptide biosynthesis B2 protein [Terriglobales bacterium]